ncbi:PliI family lysozyme inhibitor of I-type lysozyme [Chitinophaga qingshengii]|uniref:FG-GAP repeat protein n=1 Tax=Chitinophaga qingshengii TaxID=1569794 RepID=A0ABR7TIK1_9BACT|nr:PliI family lysozyme inhibitor of I-type lysozyme [Chitinophaga qingshengii]MBC9929336.1 FG-GAP repeat protein [Chitinophaga qingshengii]
MKGIQYLLPGFLLWMMMACNNLSEQKKVQQNKADDSARAATPAPKAPERPTFKMDTTFKNYRFSVTTRGDETLRNLFISIGSVKDTTRADTIVEKDFKGAVSDVAVTDLNGDGQPELYVFSTSAGTNLYGKVYAFAIQPKGVVKINTGALDSLSGKDYKGRDSFYIQGKELIRSYPAMQEGQQDVLAKDTRKTIRYQLVKTGDAYTLKKI